MNYIKQIKMLVLLQFFLIFATLLLSSLFESSLSPILLEYLDEELESEITGFDWIILIVATIIISAHVASLIGLYKFKYWARKLFIYTTVGLTLITFFMGPYVAHAIPSTMDSIAVMVGGMILSLLLFSNRYAELALNKSHSDVTK